MKFLIVSKELVGAALCTRLLKEGHEVKLFIEKEDCKESLEGIVPKTADWRSELHWIERDGIIVFDDVGFGEAHDRLRTLGYRVVGGSPESDRMELDRGFFQKRLIDLDIPTLQFKDFESASDAIDFINENPKRWVVKQNTHLGALNYIGESKDGLDTIKILESYKTLGYKAHLQERVYGIEVAVGRFFNGNDWIGPVCINHEHKRLCNGDIGPLTPEMGTVVKFYDEDCKLYEKTLLKFKPLLKKIKYKGYFDINCIVDQNNVWPLEATARFGTPINSLFMEMLETPLSDFLEAIADGKAYQPEFKKNYGIVVSLAVPPFPLTKKKIDDSNLVSANAPIIFLDEIEASNFDHIYFEEVSKIDGSYRWTGANGWVMHIADTGEIIPETQKNVYSLINKIILPQKFYRTDIGDRVFENDIPSLKRMGYIN